MKNAAGIASGGVFCVRQSSTDCLSGLHQMLSSTAFRLALGRMTASVFAGSGR